MRLTTWNVNGIRNPFSYPPWNVARTFPAMFDILGSDIIVMQELKIQRKDLRDDMVLIDGWDAYFSLPKHKKGYSGVGIYTRNATCAPIKAEEGLLGALPSPSGVPYCELPEEQSIGGYPNALQVAELGVDPAALDAEGRCMILEFPAFVLFGIYSPANSNGLRDDFRYGFICALDCRIRNLSRLGKRVVLVGDLNVSRDELDTASSAEDCRKAGITHEDYISTPNRRIFNQLLVGGEVVGERDEGRERGILVDTTRTFHPDRKGMYTHWEQKINARPGNFGSRIDFVLVSESMRPWIEDANIQEGLLGSDHCPVYADFHDAITIDGSQKLMIDMMNPSGSFDHGSRVREWKVSEVPAFSAKRMPEFDKRRSIKSMFTAPAARKPPAEPASTTLEEDQSPVKQVPNSQSTSEVAANGSATQRPSASPLKRKASVTPKTKFTKSQKTEPKAAAGKGQQSLKGFFVSQEKRASEDTASTSQSSATKTEADPNYDRPNAANARTPPPDDIPGTASGANLQSTPATTVNTDLSPSPSPTQITARLAAAEQNQRSWGALFARPAAPLCEGHDEPCKTMQTKKKGSNQGRSFWMCARPLGPSGEKEKGTQWRCPTFIWCSDWSGKKEGSGEG